MKNKFKWSPTMFKKQLWWIIPSCFVLGVVCGIGFYAYAQMVENRYMFDIAMCCIQDLHNISVSGMICP